jgi:hypothetical protein
LLGLFCGIFSLEFCDDVLKDNAWLLRSSPVEFFPDYALWAEFDHPGRLDIAE